MDSFIKTRQYVKNINLALSDDIDRMVLKLLEDEYSYERASQALRRRFVRGAQEVEGIDRGARKTKIKRVGSNGKYDYFLLGTDGKWTKPEERIWIVAMYALWQSKK